MGSIIFKKIVIIGGGIAGISAAIALREQGVSSENMLLLDKDEELGGILKYNLDGSYGLFALNNFVTSYEFLNFLIEKVDKLEIKYCLNTYVSEISDKSINIISKELGRIKINFEVLIIATGSKQIVNLNSYAYDDTILNWLTTGILFQKNIVLNGVLLSKDVLIMGSNTRELSLAKRIILEGGNVKAVIESEPKILSNHLSLIRFLKLHNVKIYVNSNIEKINEISTGFQNYLDVLIKTGDNTEKNILCGKIVCPAKYIPETKFINNYLKLGDKNEVLINDKFMTNKEGIFSVGNSCNLYANGDSVYVDAIYLAKCVLNYINKIENFRSENIPVNYSRKHIELVSPRYITDNKEKKHFVILPNSNNIYRQLKVLINGNEFSNFEILRFEKYIEVLLDLENYEHKLEKIEILFV